MQRSLCLLLTSLTLLLPIAAPALRVAAVAVPAQNLPADTLPADTVPVPAAPLTMVQRLDSLVQTDPLLTRSQLGLMVYDLTADSVVYQSGEKQLLRPASTEKLLTSITALRYLGPDYRFNTSLYEQQNAERDSTTFRGDLYVRAGFDPMFSADDMQAFVQALRDDSIGVIAGDVVLDLSIKDTLTYGWGWCWDDEDNPQLTPLQYESGQGGPRPGLQRLPAWGGPLFRADQADRNAILPTLSPLQYDGRSSFETAMRAALARAGIQLLGGFVRGFVPHDVMLLSRRYHTIDQVLHTMLKRSNNRYAEAMFYQLGARTGRAWAGRERSTPFIHQLIRELGLNPADYQIADGSGLSLYNQASSELLVTLLRYAARTPAIYDHLLPALPLAGDDGTLRSRLIGTQAQWNVRAKTGTLRSVSTLAGYCTTSSAHHLCFAIMNQGLRTNAEGHRFQDKVCRILTE